MSKFPFKQKRISENTILRIFTRDTSSDDLVWHRDRACRTVKVLVGEGWSIQHDNAVPRKLTEGSTFKVKSGQYHRLLKGDTDLILKIVEEREEGQKRVGGGQFWGEEEEDAGALDEDGGSTIKYNADPALKGDQTKLPDKLQKGIIDKERF